ncbi:RNA polymerase sigma factor [Kineobactrum salinum]|uniref:Sigma-70 family RNA polymerase sigma factor n=1 Tax=Kineobactrum salinum TaxID=2708301 RepID=A0A6C0U8V3_9GAMM|nr:sigma-70 family RNA polymerase sigma factor [Kineobactrum salinum]QIB66995.1 sigma-70 family RNA polymerase sigma factor [Kineobactrum salinum]
MKKNRESDRQFVRLFLSSRPRLFSLVSRYLKRPQDVEDVVQETFVRSYQSWIDQRIEQPENYLFRTARNLSLKHLGSHNNKITDFIEDLELSEVLDSGDSVLRQIEGSERFALFCEATRALPEQCRKVFILKKVYGLRHNEIAERLGITVSTANQHLAKALARVTEYMREHGYLEGGDGE